MGTTLQAGVLSPGEPLDGIRLHNEFIARRAGITEHARVLDAGCGFCGPAVDSARTIPGSRYEAVTISARQAIEAKAQVERAGLTEAIHVLVADYHQLPFGDQTFDVAQFLESSMHAARPDQVFTEAFRVLKPGGRLYIKDGFIQEHRNAEEQAANRTMDDLFRMKTRTLPQTIALIESAGFVIDGTQALTGMVNGRYFLNAMLLRPDRPAGPRTPLGERLYPRNRSIEPYTWPVIADIAARRP